MLSDVFHQSYLQKKDKIHHIIEHGTTNSHFLGILRVASLTHKSCCIYYFRYFNIFAWQVSFYLGLLYRDSNLVLAPKNGAHYLFPSEKSRGGNNCPIVFIYLTIKRSLFLVRLRASIPVPMQYRRQMIMSIRLQISNSNFLRQI